MADLAHAQCTYAFIQIWMYALHNYIGYFFKKIRVANNI